MCSVPREIDYDEIAYSYEKHRSGGEEFARGLAALAQVNAESVVLDVGCGTGSTSVAFHELTEATVWAVDRSGEMLRHARRRSHGVTFVRADAHRLPFRGGKFDFAYALLVIHHLGDVPGFLRELHRVMRNGRAAILTCSHDWIRRHPMNRFFPSFASIDLARFPPIDSVRRWLRDTGFERVETRVVATEPYPADMAYVDKVADKWVSTLQLLPDEEFQQGLKMLREAVSNKAPMIHREGVLVTAVRS